MVNKKIALEKPQINEKYTVIDKNNGCVVLPCWFVQQNNTCRSFLIRGKVVEPEKNMKVLVNVDKSLNEDENDIVVVAINNNGNPDKLSDVEISVDKNGNFEFKITLNLKYGVDLSKVYRLKFQYNARIIYKNWFTTKESSYEIENEQSFEIFVRGALKNTWIGLDPGTSGSCVCIGRGGSINNPNICHLGDEIIPSVVVIPRTTEVKDDFKEYVPGVDFLYGKVARQQWYAELKSGGRGFVSIKKLLGYNSENKIQVIMQNGTAYFRGAEIAHLLIKGINKDAKASISNFSDVENRTYLPSGPDSCNRLVVAIPNNYTLPKILDMVQSIQWLNEYEEIRYIYEPEAIVFNYLMKEFQTISSKNGEIVMVFDMGGATINVSVYKLEVQGREDGSDAVCVKTLGKVGYAVGGDNIDFALIETLLNLYVGARQNNITEVQRNAFEADYKDELLPKIFEFKLALIEAKRNNNYKGIFSTAGTFIQFVNQCFDHLVDLGFKPIDEDFLKIYLRLDGFAIWEDYRENIIEHILSSDEMNHYVFDRVKEAVGDVLSFTNGGVNKLVFSGRSVLFPGVKETVKTAMPTKVDIEWKGMSDSEIKSAVAKGACWYGMYSTSVRLDNELITSSYGYGMTIDGVYKFCPVINSSNTFDKDGVCRCKQEIASAFNNDANFVKFYQMMGNTKSQVFDENAKYKRSYLGDVQIYTNTQSIEMSVDRNDNVVYQVNFEDGNKYSSGLMHSINRDITDENDRAYCFATLSSEQKVVSTENVQSVEMSEADVVQHQEKLDKKVETVCTELSEEMLEREGHKRKSKRTRI